MITWKWKGNPVVNVWESEALMCIGGSWSGEETKSKESGNIKWERRIEEEEDYQDAKEKGCTPPHFLFLSTSQFRWLKRSEWGLSYNVLEKERSHQIQNYFIFLFSFFFFNWLVLFFFSFKKIIIPTSPPCAGRTCFVLNMSSPPSPTFHVLLVALFNMKTLLNQYNNLRFFFFVSNKILT